MSKTLTKDQKQVLLLKEQKEKLQNRINVLKSTIESKKEQIAKKNEKLRQFKTKDIYIAYNREIATKDELILSLKQTIVKRQESGCYECRSTDNVHRHIKFSNLSICIECISKAEKSHWSKQ